MRTKVIFLALLFVNLILFTAARLYPELLPIGITRGDASICAAIYLVGVALLVCQREG